MERYTNLMKNLECHFNWDIRAVVGEKDIIEKLSEKNEEIAGQPWRNLLITLTLAYELRLKNRSGANEKLQEVIAMWGNDDDDFIMKYKDAFRHVIFSIKLFFATNTSSNSVMKEIFEYIPPYATLPTEQKVALTAIKAHVFSEYGPDGTKYALTLAKEAVKGNPKEGEWSFLVGKMLSRIRQFTLDHCVTEDELECLRHAYSLSKSPAHAVFLAQTYCSISKALYQKLPVHKGRRILNDNEGRIVRGYNEKAYNLYREALEGNKDKCVHINFRCARGLFNLPGEFKDITKALEIVEKTLERAPTNVYGNSIACNIYYRFQQYDKAFKHADAAEEGGSYGASIKKLQMKIELKMDVNLKQAYEDIFNRHPEMMYKIQTSMHAITYYIFKKRDIFLALKYFFMAAAWDATLDNFYHYVYWIGESTDVCFIVYNEVQTAIDSNKSKHAKQLKQLKDAITIINSKYPKVTEKQLQRNLVEFLLQRSRRFPPRRNMNKSKQVNTRNKKDYNDENKKNNFQQKRGQNKNDNGPNRRRRSRTRTESESSNVSATSASSYASASSFTRIRRNSKEACLLNIVSKDMETAARCQQMKDIKSNDTPLRPRQETIQPHLGFSPKEKRPLSMGCSGWNKKSQSNESLNEINKSISKYKDRNYKHQQNDFSQLGQMFKNMNIGNKTDYNRRKYRSFSDADSKPDGNILRRSLNPTLNSAVGLQSTDSKFESDGSFEKHSFRKVDKSFYTNVQDTCNFERTNRESYTERSNQTRGYNKSYNQGSNFNRDVNFRQDTQKFERSSRESSNERNTQRTGYNQNRNFGQSNTGGKTFTNKTCGDKKNIRKPFNLSRSDLSLDSDDSLPRRSPLHGSFDRLSTSSVDSDYVRDSSKPYFPWQKKYDIKK